MLSCTCGGHGSCLPNATHIRSCVCDYPYTGPECGSCVEGYHRSANLCVTNVKCNATSCNGHGTCDDLKGYPECTCYSGYESTASALCAQCHSGYTGYPNCTKKTDDRKTRCTAPLLPTDLGTVAYLHGTPSKEVFHIQGEYFVDLDHIQHDMYFSLAQTSFLR